MPWLEVWVDEAESIAKRLIESIPKKEMKDGEQVMKKLCLESSKKIDDVKGEKRARANSI